MDKLEKIAAQSKLRNFLIQEDDKEAVEQWQRAPAPDSPSRLALLDALDRAGTVLREERFPARPGAWCERCDFTAICPAVGADAVVR